jgi:TolA-binding protein
LLCERIVADYPQDEYAKYASLQLAELRVYELIDAGNYESADANVSATMKDFAGHKQLTRRLYEIADEYAKNEAWTYAKALYGRTAADYPKDKYGLKAKLGIPRTNVLSLIMSQDYNQAEATLDKMVADFNNNPYLDEAILTIGLQCYDGGLSKERQGLAVQAVSRFEKAVEMWDRVINEFPRYSLIPEICCRAGDCYHKLGKYEEAIQRYQKVVDDYPEYAYAWHAQFMVGYCYEGLKNTGAVEKSVADALTKAAYEQLIQNYPDCQAADYVRSWLSGIRAEKEK